MKRPHVNVRCNADHYADHRVERIIEFDGGLICFRNCDDGTLRVELYRLSENVRVSVDRANLLHYKIDPDTCAVAAKEPGQ